jgi:hypothetical protein
MKRVELNIYLTEQQYAQIARLRETGLNMSSLARLAIRKFAADTLVAPSDSSKSKRVLIYLDLADAQTLENVAAREGVSRSEALRQLLAKYLTVNSRAIDSLF